MKQLLSLLSLFFLLSTPLALAQQKQEREEDVVRLVKADRAESFQSDNVNLRLVSGNAQFIHNDVLIYCDSALWNLNLNSVDAIGRVKILHQENTLKGDRINYLADSSIAKVRGSIVELIDKSGNRLRTRHLDYNTRDSIAHFFNGGSMIDTSNNIIESVIGYYYSKIEKFKFIKEVELSADEMMLKCDSLVYLADNQLMLMYNNIHGWQQKSYISAQRGIYDTDREDYHFFRKTYLNDPQYEVWCDSLHYKKELSEAVLTKDIQILDTAQSVLLFSDFAKVIENPTKAILYNNPSLAYYSIEDGRADTLFCAADTLKYSLIDGVAIDSLSMATYLMRKGEAKRDPVKEQYFSPKLTDSLLIENSNEQKEADSLLLSATSDSLLLRSTPDSLLLSATPDSLLPSATSDSLSQSLDTTQYRFIEALKRVRLYRKDIQMICDSMQFNSVDSLIRLYIDPVIWNEGDQFLADSIFLVASNGEIEKAELLSNPFLISPIDSIYYNQIRASEMIAWFEKGDLYRYDALGGVTRLVFVEEDSTLTTMNKLEAKVMSATLSNREVQIIRSFEAVKNEAFPLFELEEQERRLKGFNLRDEERPKDRFEVCDRVVYLSKREESGKVPPPSLKYTKRFYHR